MYKLNIYKQSGKDKGMFDREEFFKTKIEAVERYEQLRNPKCFGLNPTLWVRNAGDNEWKRIEGY